MYFLPLDAGRLAERRGVVSSQSPDHGVLKVLRQGVRRRDAWPRGDARGRDGGVREELAAGVKHKGTNIMIGGLPGHDD